MTGRTRLLVDLRDDDNLRGFHVLASLYLIADHLRMVELYRLGGDAPNERIAMRAFSFDTGLEFRRIWRLLLVDSKFDIYVSAANAFPCDRASVAARRTSRRAVVALMFGAEQVCTPVKGIVLNGHNTGDNARTLIDELSAFRREDEL
jgi:hypothetical protein